MKAIDLKCKIAPSLLSADFSCLKEQVELVENANADLLHLDVMDGHFVPNITFGPVLLESLKKWTKLPFDVHLMIENPDRFIKTFLDCGAEYITFHYEVCNGKQIKKILSSRGRKTEKGYLKIGLAIKPKTKLKRIYPYLENLDLVLLMTVEPGFSGQKFMPEVLLKINKLRKIIEKKKYNLEIEIDGGINPRSAKLCALAGANIFVAGNSIFRSGDIRKAVQELRESIQSKKYS